MEPFLHNRQNFGKLFLLINGLVGIIAWRLLLNLQIFGEILSLGQIKEIQMGIAV